MVNLYDSILRAALVEQTVVTRSHRILGTHETCDISILINPIILVHL